MAKEFNSNDAMSEFDAEIRDTIDKVVKRLPEECQLYMEKPSGTQTVGEFIDAVCANPIYYLGQIIWMLCHMEGVLSPELRHQMVEAIAGADPPAACIVYRHAKRLTNEEENLLIHSFYDTMPIMRNKFINGQFNRDKDKGT